jgi:(1->4)-alpha-D-glucan 1-alpha-D-glucosylmutase
VFIDGRHARQLRRLHARFTGLQKPFDEIVYESKRTIMLTAMASELNVLAHALNRISERDCRHRDYTLNSCRTVIREVIACFPVYRTYISERGADTFDRTAIQEAIRLARQRNPVIEASIFDFLQEILLSEPDANSPDDTLRAERRRFAMRFPVLDLSASADRRGGQH